MQIKINGKTLFNIGEHDLNDLVNNLDYRENDFLEYKETLPFIFMNKADGNEKKRKDAIAEFRRDVCSFANAQGGYLLYGISEEKGCAKEIKGIDLPANNTDQFERECNAKLQLIFPVHRLCNFILCRYKAENMLWYYMCITIALHHILIARKIETINFTREWVTRNK